MPVGDAATANRQARRSAAKVVKRHCHTVEVPTAINIVSVRDSSPHINHRYEEYIDGQAHQSKDIATVNWVGGVAIANPYCCHEEALKHR